MTKLLLAMLLLTSSYTYASNDIIKEGKGTWICSSIGTQNYPSLARAILKVSATKLAQKRCADYQGSLFGCKVTKCVKDRVATNRYKEINFLVKRNNSNILINPLKGEARYLCSIKTSENKYITKAPTQLEAKVLVKQVCLQDGFLKNCKITKCQKAIKQNKTTSLRLLKAWVGSVIFCR